MDGETDLGPALSPYMHVFKCLPVPWGCESWWPQQGFQLLTLAVYLRSPFLPMWQLTEAPSSPCGN